MFTRTFQKIVLVTLFTLSASAFAEDFNKFYIQGIIGSSIKEISESNLLAGVDAVGKLGGVDTSASKATFGLKLGYRLSETLRFDLSYYDLSYGKTTWGTDFCNCQEYNPNNATPFSAHLSSDTVFASAYYSVNSSVLPKGLSPYFGIGLGSSRNKFKDGTGNYGIGDNDLLGNKTKNSFAYKFDLGVEYAISKNFGIDAAVTFMDIGKFSSANYRDYAGFVETIAPYTFTSDLAPIYNLGISYKF
jgi:opacity protein-like surface antigen